MQCVQWRGFHCQEDWALHPDLLFLHPSIHLQNLSAHVQWCFSSEAGVKFRAFMVLQFLLVTEQFEIRLQRKSLRVLTVLYYNIISSCCPLSELKGRQALLWFIGRRPWTYHGHSSTKGKTQRICPGPHRGSILNLKKTFRRVDSPYFSSLTYTLQWEVEQIAVWFLLFCLDPATHMGCSNFWLQTAEVWLVLTVFIMLHIKLLQEYT